MQLIKKIFILLNTVPIVALSQNVGIGVSDASRAFLEIHGAAGSGRTAALFGGQLGISFQKSIPTIGFNQYNDNATEGVLGKYMANGFAATVSYTHDDPTYAKGLSIDIYPSGIANNPLLPGKQVLRFSNGSLRLSTTTNGANLVVGRADGLNATAIFSGTTYASSFNVGIAENTTIRAGKNGSTVRINDANTGNVYFGSSAVGTRVGINSADPQYSFEIRQVANTGLKMVNVQNDSWEWRVGYSGSLSGINTSLAHFYAIYNGTPKAYFSIADGGLNTISDGRLKNNVVELPSVMEKILKLEALTYEFIHNNPEHQRSLGFIAQDVAPLFPQIAVTNAPDQTQLLQYSGFGVIAIKGVQEEQQKIDLLKDKMDVAEKLLKAVELKLQTAKSKK